jgi:hypothetical protein
MPCCACSPPSPPPAAQPKPLIRVHQHSTVHSTYPEVCDCAPCPAVLVLQLEPSLNLVSTHYTDDTVVPTPENMHMYLEVSDCAPCPAVLVCQLLQGLHQALPAGLNCVA